MENRTIGIAIVSLDCSDDLYSMAAFDSTRKKRFTIQRAQQVEIRDALFSFSKHINAVFGGFNLSEFTTLFGMVDVVELDDVAPLTTLIGEEPSPENVHLQAAAAAALMIRLDSLRPVGWPKKADISRLLTVPAALSTSTTKQELSGVMSSDRRLVVSPEGVAELSWGAGHQVHLSDVPAAASAAAFHQGQAPQELPDAAEPQLSRGDVVGLAVRLSPATARTAGHRGAVAVPSRLVAVDADGKSVQDAWLLPPPRVVLKEWPYPDGADLVPAATAAAELQQTVSGRTVCLAEKLPGLDSWIGARQARRLVALADAPPQAGAARRAPGVLPPRAIQRIKKALGRALGTRRKPYSLALVARVVADTVHAELSGDRGAAPTQTDRIDAMEKVADLLKPLLELDIGLVERTRRYNFAMDGIAEILGNAHDNSV